MKPDQAPTSILARTAFANDVETGLTKNPKSLLPKYFYDELGSQLFEAICYLPEYYPTRSETEILQRHAREIIGNLKGRYRLVELGSGSSVKTRYLLEALLERQETLTYQPIDISESILEQSAQRLSTAYPKLQIKGQVRDYTTGLGTLDRNSQESILVLFLGSNIGNYDPIAARNLLRQIRSSLRPGDAFLLGADLIKSPDILEAAYDDALGVTAAFNLNLLVRLNRELHADFDLKKFAHRAFYNSDEHRIEMHLVSRLKQQVNISALNLTVDFYEGETIHTENSWKFDAPRLKKLAADTGFELEKTWTDQAGNFSCSLLRI